MKKLTVKNLIDDDGGAKCKMGNLSNPIPQYGQTRIDALAAAIRQECERQECIPRHRLLDILGMYV